MSFYTNVARRGNNMLVKWIDDDGKRHQDKVPFKPELFTSSVKDEGMMCHKGIEQVGRHEFDTIRDAQDFISTYSGIAGMNLHGMDDYVLQFINRAFRNEDNPNIQFDKRKIRTAWLDIEVSSFVNGVDYGMPHAMDSHYPITCIGTLDQQAMTYHLHTWGYVDHERLKAHPKLQGCKIEVHRYAGEFELMQDWLVWWRGQDFDNIVGFNSESFDVTYITNRSRKIVGAEHTKLLSPYGLINEREVTNKFGAYQTFDWIGINMLDYLHIYKKHTFITHRSYKLDNLANFELKTGKLTYAEAGSLNALWSGHFRTEWTDPVDTTIGRLSKLRTAIGDKLAVLGIETPLGRDHEESRIPEHPPEPNYLDLPPAPDHDKIDLVFDGKINKARTEIHKELIESARRRAHKRVDALWEDECDRYRARNAGEDTKVSTVVRVNKFLDNAMTKAGVATTEKYAAELSRLYHTLDKRVIQECQQLYHEYNLVDVKVMFDIDQKRKLIDLTFTLAYFCQCNYQTTLTTIKPWEALVYKSLVQRNRQPPIKERLKDKTKFPGAYVMDPVLGKQKWVFSFDLNSLYPHVEMQVNTGPETIIEPEDLPQEVQQLIPSDMNHEEFIVALSKKEIDLSVLKKYGISMSGFRQFFRKDEMSFFSEIKRELYNNRKAIKRAGLQDEQGIIDTKRAISEQGESAELLQQLDDFINGESAKDSEQMAMKILLNSGYGATGNSSFRYFDIRIAASITSTGQVAIRWIGRKTNEYLNKTMGTTDVRYVIYTDTDSIYVNVEALVNKVMPDETDELKIVRFLDQVGEKKLVPLMAEWYEELADYLNSYENKMVMAREVIAPSATWTSKKRYAMKVWNSEGVQYDKPKMKVMGLESVRSTTPAYASDYLVECYALALDTDDETEMHEKIADIRDEFDRLDNTVIAEPTSVNGLTKWADKDTLFKKGCPHHVKAALYHNKLVADNQWRHINPIQNGEKIMMVPLKAGLEMKKIAFVGELPTEFELEDLVDRTKLYNSKFANPMQNFLDSLGWSPKRVAKIGKFMKKRT